MLVSRRKLDDSSNLVKAELARIAGHLTCVQSGSSQLTVIHTELSTLPTILCSGLSLSTEHAGKTVTLKADVIRPLLPLLHPQTHCSVKQGVCGFHFTSHYFYSFSRRFYPKRLPRESFTKGLRSLINNKIETEKHCG